MSRQSIIDNFDLSHLNAGEKEQPIPPVNPFIEKKTEVKESKTSVSLAKAVTSNSLHKYPEYFDYIIQENGLEKLWQGLFEMDTITVIESLAINRVLNFYEGSIGMLSKKELQQGIIICILSASPSFAGVNGAFPTAHSAMPCFYRRQSVKYSDFAGISVSEETFNEALAIVGRFSAYIMSSRLVKNHSMLLYLYDAWKMWVCSGDASLIAFMGKGANRLDYVSEGARRSGNLTGTLGYYHVSNSPDAHTLTLMSTNWGRCKSIIHNTPGLIRQIGCQ